MKEENETGSRANLRSILLIALIIAGVGGVVLLQSRGPTGVNPGQSQFGKGLPAPDFTLPDLEGNMVRLSDYRGKVVLLNIWATWCPPCVEEMPSMEALHRKMKGEAFEILAVSIDTDGSQSVAPFMQKHKLTFPALTDTKGLMQDLYRTTGVPESLIIDKNGIVVEKIIGPQDWASPEVVQFFKGLVAGQ